MIIYSIYGFSCRFRRIRATVQSRTSLLNDPWKLFDYNGLRFYRHLQEEVITEILYQVYQKKIQHSFFSYVFTDTQFDLSKCLSKSQNSVYLIIPNMFASATLAAIQGKEKQLSLSYYLIYNRRKINSFASIDTEANLNPVP